MQMHARRESGLADPAHKIALPDAIAGADGNRRQVQVLGFVTVRMAHLHRASATVRPAGERDDSGSDGTDGCAQWRVVVDTVVRARVAENRMLA